LAQDASSDDEDSPPKAARQAGKSIKAQNASDDSADDDPKPRATASKTDAKAGAKKPGFVSLLEIL
jgi:hypothetical protein